MPGDPVSKAPGHRAAAVFMGIVWFALPAAAAEPARPRAAQPKDPAYAQVDDVPGLPRVLLLGDSVSVGYTLAVRKELAGKANVHRPGANCGSTKIGLRDLDRWLGNKKWDVIHFNWGLHDLGYRFENDSNANSRGEYARPDNGGHQNVSPAEYEKNLRELVARLKRTGAALIFATTTPVPADLHSYVKAAELPYNTVARKVMREEGIVINDLWQFVQPQLAAIQEPGNPHFTARGSTVLARQIARVIEDALQARRQSTATDNTPERLMSPDGTIEVIVSQAGGLPQWQVLVDRRPVMEPGRLGVELVRDGFAAPLALASVARSEGDATWHPLWGDRAMIRDHYRQLTLSVQEAAGAKRRFEIVLRAYNEGVALRYRVPKQPGIGKIAIKRRLTEYPFGNRPIYQTRKYEYGSVTVANMSKSEGAIAIDVGSGFFVGLTDADRSGFAQVSWERKRDLSETVVGALSSAAEGEAPFETSWEVMLVGRGPAGLYENRHLVENLNPSCTLTDTRWIRPGKAISQVRNVRMVTDEMKQLMDFASKHRIEYVEIDHSWCGAETKWTSAEIAFFDKNRKKFWDDKPEWRNNVGGNPKAPAKGWVPFRPKADSGGNYVDLDPAAVAAYGASLQPPVGLCVYVRGVVLKEFGGEHPADEVFAVYQRWGLAGIKLGFVPSAAQQNERAIAEVVVKAAAHKLIVNIHDSYFPAGLSRTWPNLMNVEGVAGEEAEPSIEPAMKSRHDVMLPFTRGLMGPLDYTPEMFKTSKTHAHQVALVGAYPGRPTIRGGMKQWSPGGVGGGEVEFVEKLPGRFDSLKVITELGKYVTVARQSGTAWFVASLGDGQTRSYDLALDFLTPNVTYRASIYRDTPGKPQTTHETKSVTSQSIIRIVMEPNGGHLMIVEPVGR